MEKISCKMCGSSDLTVKGDLIVCNSCGTKFSDDNNTKSALKEDINPTLYADLIFDFTVAEKQCSNILYQWLISGAYVPDDILQKSKLLSLKKVFLPTYLFNGSYSMNWTASSGYNYTEKYQEWDKYKNEYVTKKRTLTDWRPSSGTVQDNFCEMIVSNSKVPSNLAAFIGARATFSGKDGTPFDYFDTTNCTLLPYTKDEDAAFDVAKKNVDKQISSQVNNQVPGDTYKDVNWSGQTSHRTCKVYYPAYLGSFEYDGKTYSYIIDGRNAKNIFGNKPVEKEKIDNAKKSFIPLKITAILTPILTFIVMMNTEDAFMLLSLLVGLIGIILSIILYFVGKRRMNNQAIKPQIRRLAMLKILQDTTLSEVEKNKKMQDCLKDIFSVQITQKELLEFQQANYVEDKNGTNNVNGNILDVQHMILAGSALATIAAPFVGFIVKIFSDM